MKNLARIFAVALCIMFSLSLYAAGDPGSAEALFGVENISPELQNGGGDLVGTVNSILGFIIGLLYFIAVVFGIYAGFTILTGAGDEEKMKKGKNILIYVVVGLIVIFLASQIVRWVISVLSDTEIVG